MAQSGIGLGRRQVATLIDAGRVRVNGRSVRNKATLVRPGDDITCHGPLPTPPLVATPGSLTLLYEDADVVVVDKAPGVPSVAGATAGPSIAGMLLARYPEMAAIDSRRGAGLVHRLDTATSGLLLAARRLEVYRRLRRAFTAKTIEKQYLAVVEGEVTRSGTIDTPLRRRPGRRARVTAARPRTPGAWDARTEFAPLCQGDGLTLLSLLMRTGVTHQLRVHLAMRGHPIVGDTRYGRGAGTGAAPLPWHYLHALALRFDAPVNLPARLATAFPAHWRPLFERMRWREDAIEAVGTGP